MLENHKVTDLPGKDTVYRFLNYPKFAWRRFLLSLSAFTITKVSRLTRASHTRVLIVDDSSFYRDRSKKVELLAHCFDHAKQRHYKGFRMLTLGGLMEPPSCRLTFRY